MKTIRFINTIGAGFLTLAMVACGGGGVGGTGNTSSSEGGLAMAVKATSLNTKTVVAAAPKTSQFETMFTLLTLKEATAAHTPGNCLDDAKEFILSDGSGLASACVNSAFVVYEEIELEQEGLANGDEVELGPFVLDLIGTAGDGIPGRIDFPVSDGTFNKMKLKIGDLDDRNKDDSLDSSSNDDLPINASSADVKTAGLVGQSLVLSGTAHNGAGASKSFAFKTNLEGKIEIPIAVTAGDPLVDDGSSLITYIDLSSGFSKLTYAKMVANMDGDMRVKKCSDIALDDSQQLACDIVKNIDLFDDIDDDGLAEVEEHRGDDHTVGGGGLFDDSGNRD